MDLSIIIPTYNRLWSLPDAVASIPCGLTTEIIVADDGSSDGTWEWLSAQPGIVAIRQRNEGKPAAVNRGFELARGHFVRFLDSDDLLRTESARGQLQFALEQNPDICVAGYTARHQLTDTEIDHSWNDCGDFLSQQLGECDSSHYSAFLFRRQALATIRHRPEFAFRDDRMFILECALNLPKVAIWPELTLVHRHHPKPRIQFQNGSTAVVTNWQERRMFESIVESMKARGILTGRRGAAMGNNLWELAQRVAAYNMREARQILAMQQELAPRFSIPASGRNQLYRALGFSGAQRCINFARAVRDIGRQLRAAV